MFLNKAVRAVLKVNANSVLFIGLPYFNYSAEVWVNTHSLFHNTNPQVQHLFGVMGRRTKTSPCSFPSWALQPAQRVFVI